MEINSNLIWDYDIPPVAKRDVFFTRWYLSRVLMRGGVKDLRSVGLPMIRRHLPHLNVPLRIRRFWEWYFKECYDKKSVQRADVLSNGRLRRSTHRTHP